MKQNQDTSRFRNRYLQTYEDKGNKTQDVSRQQCRCERYTNLTQKHKRNRHVENAIEYLDGLPAVTYDYLKVENTVHMSGNEMQISAFHKKSYSLRNFSTLNRNQEICILIRTQKLFEEV